MIGKTLQNRYVLVKLLGSGGFGDTYLALDLHIPVEPKPQCVVKHLKPKDPNPAILPTAKRLFEREAKTLYQLGNENNQIPKLFAHFEDNGEFYLVQEFIDGHDLTREIINGKPLIENVVWKLLHDILEVLVTVHRNNIIHRDIKPQNIMRRRKDGKIVLIDFGAVKEIGALGVNAQSQTNLTVAVGTPGYMPSEQAKGKPKLCSDIYAVGMIGIQALTGLMPNELKEDPTTGEIIWRSFALVSDRLADVIDVMVRDHFSQRYQSAVEALQAMITTVVLPPIQPSSSPSPSPAIQSSPVNPPQATPVRINRKQFLLWAGLGGVGLVTAVVGHEIFTDLHLWSVEFETVKVDEKGIVVNRISTQAKFFKEDLGNGVTLEMVSIPAGSFQMGSPDGTKDLMAAEGPQHTVNVPTFFLGRVEVTQEQYQQVMGKNPSHFKGAKLPVESVSKNDAMEFCKKLSQKTGRKYRLPSEAEWEYACRAGTTTPFHFGETLTTALANYDGNYTYASAPKGEYRQKTTEVGSFLPNAFGLYDMHGNVWEWCLDSWHDNYNGAPVNGSVWIQNDNQYRLLRGGSWNLNPDYCRSAFRTWYNPVTFNNYIGFRVACGGAPALTE